MAGRPNDSFSIDQMIGAYKDFARGYLFYLRVEGAPVNIDQNHHFLVNATSLPTSSITEIQANYQGNIYKLPTTHEFEAFTVTFRVDEGMNIRANMLAWQNLIHDPETNIHGNPGDFIPGATIFVWQVDNENNPTMTYELHGVWPQSVAAQTLDYGTKEIATFDVTFSYQYHTVSHGGNAVVGSGAQ